jgi:hypothetical protein
MEFFFDVALVLYLAWTLQSLQGPWFSRDYSRHYLQKPVALLGHNCLGAIQKTNTRNSLDFTQNMHELENF